METNIVYNADCFEIMNDIPDKSIDLIILDPPYNIGKAHWDKIDNYLEYIDTIFEHCERILKDNGSLYCFHNDFMVLSQMAMNIQKNTKFIFKQLLIWNKWHNEIKKGNNLQGAFYKIINNPGLRNYPKMCEYILYYTFQDETGLNKILPLCFKPYLTYMTTEKCKIGWNIKQFNEYLGYKSIASHWFYQDENMTLQPQPTWIQKKDYIKLQSTGYFQKSYESLRQEYESLRQEYEKQRYTFNQYNNDISIICYPISNSDERVNHPTQKPVDLISNLILHSSNENDIVFDPFCGSGTTVIACIQNNRKYICIEKDKEYYDIIMNRIEKENQQMRLF